MALPGYCKQALTDLPTSNVSAGTNYFIVNEKRWYFYNGVQWVKHKESLLDSEAITLLNLPNQVSGLNTSLAGVNMTLNSLDSKVHNIDVQVQSLQGVINGGVTNGVASTDYTELLLKFNGNNSSNNFIDDSKNNCLIIPSGNPIISTTESKFGGSSLYLNGSSYLTLSSIFFKGNYTIECWVKNNQASGLYGIYSQSTGGFAGESMALMLSSRALAYFENAHSSTTPLISSSTIISDSNWHHIALVRNSLSLHLFIDGVNVATVSNLRFNWSNNYPFAIGVQLGLSRFFVGYIDNFRISSKAIYTPTLYPDGFNLPDENFNTSAIYVGTTG